MQTTDTYVGRSSGKQIRTDNGNLICEAFVDPDNGTIHVYVYSRAREDGLKIVGHIE